MNAVIGQEKLVKILDGYTLHTVPKTMLFLGPSGCGKSWIAARFAESLKLPVVNIDSTITPEKLIEYYQSPIEKMYIIDLKGIDEKQQNKFLKFIEEPSATMYIILTAESEIGILPTILNRCMKYHFEEYTVDQLKQFDWAMTSNATGRRNNFEKFFEKSIAVSKKVTTFAIPIWDGGLVSSVGRAQHF